MDQEIGDVLQCSVCYDTFDVSEHMPRIAPLCGHTFCANCIIRITSFNSFTCPLCKTSMGAATLKKFPINFALAKLINSSQQLGFCCPVHQSLRSEELMVCILCKKEFCPDCSLTHHACHETKKCNTFIEEVRLMIDDFPIAKQVYKYKDICVQINHARSTCGSIYDNFDNRTKTIALDTIAEAAIRTDQTNWRNLGTWFQKIGQPLVEYERTIKRFHSTSDLKDAIAIHHGFADMQILVQKFQNDVVIDTIANNAKRIDIVSKKKFQSYVARCNQVSKIIDEEVNQIISNPVLIFEEPAWLHEKGEDSRFSTNSIQILSLNVSGGEGGRGGAGGGGGGGEPQSNPTNPDLIISDDSSLI